MNSTIKVLSTTSQQNIKINYLFQIIYANLKWAKKSKGKIMNFTEDLHFYFIETGSKYQVNYFQIQKKDFSFKKIIVSKRKKGEKILRCENGKLEVNFNKETKFYHPKNLTLKCYTDDDTFLYKHQISFLKTLPFKKLNKNSENVYRILKLYTNGLAETP
ncbi:MAG: hypothetical protein AB8B78_02755 [Polaribacter sp.]